MVQTHTGHLSQVLQGVGIDRDGFKGVPSADGTHGLHRGSREKPCGFSLSVKLKVGNIYYFNINNYTMISLFLTHLAYELYIIM